MPTRMPSQQAQQVDTSPGRVGAWWQPNAEQDYCRSGGNIAPRGRIEVRHLHSSDGDTSSLRHEVKIWSEVLERCWHWTNQ